MHLGIVMQLPGGLQRQPNSWTCGPAALRHALLFHGVRASTRRLAELAGITRAFDGDTVPGLVRACRTASKGRCWMNGADYDSAGVARLALQNRITEGSPVLVCVDNWLHWVCVYEARTLGGVRYLDSTRDGGEIDRTASWSDFLDRAAKREAGVTRWDLYPVVKLS